MYRVPSADPAARIVRNGGMEPRPDRYCIEHHEPGQPPVVLRTCATYHAAVRALSQAAERLMVAGAAGRVVLIDCGLRPEREIEHHDLGTPPVSEPTGHTTERGVDADRGADRRRR